ncbi:MAG: lipopolysaccharide biosynthesis protein [Polaromonas sp.]|nr:lipopolysaccharide biosynthesis protein [Polaromonas sp.]
MLAIGITYLIPPAYTASTTFMPPQQAQGAAASALASLGSLAGLAGGAAGVRNTGEQYVALMQSVTVSDRLIDQFKLAEVYDAKYRVDARTELAQNVRISLNKKDGMISVLVDDTSPQRAADIANRYVEELRRVAASFAVTEAQQRRVFFEQQLRLSRDQLLQAQQALQASGFNASALKAEPKAAAEGYAKLRAEATAAEVRLQVSKGSLTESTPEVRQQQATLNALREQLAKAAQPAEGQGGPDYISRFRDFKYQETLFELYARQFELARVDESREGALIQVVDPATPPEKKSKPRRGQIAISTTLTAALLLTIWVVFRHRVTRSRDT